MLMWLQNTRTRKMQMKILKNCEYKKRIRKRKVFAILLNKKMVDLNMN
jgi:hypothetical protein